MFDDDTWKAKDTTAIHKLQLIMQLREFTYYHCKEQNHLDINTRKKCIPPPPPHKKKKKKNLFLLHTHSMGLEPITSASIPLLQEEEMPVEP